MQPLQPIFVGGTGRSGSTVVGYLLGAHPAIWNTLPREIRFLTDPDGLLDLTLGVHTRIQNLSTRSLPGLDQLLGALRRHRVRDAVTREDFLRQMYGPWWQREIEGEQRGLQRGIDEDALHRALQTFDATHDDDPRGASAALVHDLLDDPARARGAVAWADTTPQNAENAHRIVELMPEARVVFMVRDGRDTAASVLGRHWGPTSPIDALEWWRNRTLRAMRSMARVGPTRGLTVRLGRLVETDREETLHRLFGFLGFEVTPEVRAYFADAMTPRHAHTRRWQRDIPSEHLRDFEHRYGEIWEELTDLGLDLPAL